MKNKIIKFLIVVGVLMFMNSCSFLDSGSYFCQDYEEFGAVCGE